MRDYSQNGEQKIILNYFKEFKGTVLDIGANDGITLSNSYALIQNGWNGVLVEPCEKVYDKIASVHKGKDFIGVNAAISNKDGDTEFFESGTHLHNGDHSLLSTLKPSEMGRWVGTGTDFMPTTVRSITFETLLQETKVKFFDFITIDAEGFDYEILSQINLNKVECKMLCIETNSIQDSKFIAYCMKFGMRVHFKNSENLIFTR